MKTEINVSKLKKSFESIKKEFDDHRLSINENTNEIRDNFEYMNEIDSKINKLSDRIEDICMFIEDLKKEKNSVHSLSWYEQKVFLALYLEHSELSFFEVVKRTQLPAAMVEKILDSLVDKNIPIIVEKVNNQNIYLLDPNFKERQTKENIVKVDESVTKSLFVKDLNSYM